MSSSAEDNLSDLERQLERAGLFTHTAIGRCSIRVNEVEAFTYGLLDALLEKGILCAEEVKAKVEKVKEESITRGDACGPGLALRLDAPDAKQLEVKVNCVERLPICHSICCKLDFPLTVEEVESGEVRWDLGRPYHIRQGADGYCVHRNQESGFCGVYERRPGFCRTYNCSSDTRIWKDFEKMELNTEWLEEHLQGRNQPQMLGAVLYQIQVAPHQPSAKSEEAPLVAATLPKPL
jgi:Fe-S-cluster containining protein